MISQSQSTPESKPQPALWDKFQRWAAPTLAAGYQLVALTAMLVWVLLAGYWFQIPFIGALLEHTMIFNALESVRADTWDANTKGIDFGHQLVAIDGDEIADIHAYLQKLGDYAVGDQITLTVAAPDGDLLEKQIILARFPTADRIAYMIIPWIIGAVYLGSGLWVFSLRHGDEAGRAFALFAASAAMATAGFFDVNTTNRLTYLWTFSLAMTGGALFNLALVFPQTTRWTRRWPFSRWLGYGIMLPLLLIAFPTLFNLNRPRAYIQAWGYEFVFIGVVGMFFIALAFYRRFWSKTPLVRQQGRIILWGAFIAFLPLSLWFLLTANRPDIGISPYLLLTLTFFPLTVSYAILRYRLLNTDYVLSRVVIYALLTVLAVGSYAFIVSGLGLFIGGALLPTNPYVIGALTFLMALLLSPMRARLRWVVDSFFFRGQKAYQDRLDTFRQQLNPALGLGKIGSMMRQYAQDSLSPSQFHIFLHDSLRGFYTALAGDDAKPTTDLRFAANSALAQSLARTNNFIFLGAGEDLPATLQPDKARLAILGAQAFMPLQGREKQLVGFVALGPRRSGEPYTNLDLEFLTSLSNQAAMAIENSQVVLDLERSINEMNVLARVSQGINVTLNFDDILELIYAQTNQLFPSKDFWVLLHDAERNIYQYAFCLENDIRLLARENSPVKGDQELSRAVMRAGRPIVTDDYARECRTRGYLPTVDGVYAWMGVHLSAGAETIGALSLASRDPSVSYSKEQIDFLKSIADQAAGAIVKTRLIAETERRAKQLGLLNDISRNLTSTLDLSDLLNQVLTSAIDIGNCEAGTLFLVDEETGELIFEVVAGPVADELVGQRLAPGTGHVGQAVRTGKAAIVNQARDTTEWTKNTDEQTGFQTRDLLLAPMIAQDRVIGVVETINRRDGLPFTQDDQDLLMAFAGQAAIALENTRLYTLTDQQLAARVDELSVMQRIDRELNASLDIDRAMRITLEWAMRQSGADAGLVGAVEDDGLLIMADQGYAHELAFYRQTGVLPLREIPGLGEAVSAEQTQIISRHALSESIQKSGLLDDIQAQLVIPIRREDQVIGVLLLESRAEEPWAEYMQEFLSRLSDHAAIAIANARLFARVQQADDAKSQFVSLVAHELKTPMTSIRGYADLLLAGAMGEINDVQEEFLGTIRSNVDRMATLVSDLADVSRIETGHLRIDFRSVDTADFINEVIRSQQTGLDQKQQKLVLAIPNDLPPVWGDRTRLVQVLVNLVSNASKYTPEGGEITVRAERKANLWDDEGAAEVILLAVSDTGIGMEQEDQVKIFTKFFRSEDPKAREASGTGLGLNITKQLVEMQGGKIWFESVYREGTTFYFTVPISQV